MIGAVVKPVSGSLDLISKTSEGFKNTAKMFDEEEKEIHRSRNPRPFYTEYEIV